MPHKKCAQSKLIDKWHARKIYLDLYPSYCKLSITNITNVCIKLKFCKTMAGLCYLIGMGAHYVPIYWLRSCICGNIHNLHTSCIQHDGTLLCEVRYKFCPKVGVSGEIWLSRLHPSFQ